jgi:polysaccharide export outer membrane protein
MKNLSITVLTLFSIVLLSSCATQNLFQGQRNVKKDSTYVKAELGGEHIIKKDDKITLSIWNHDDLSVGSLYGIYNSNEVYGKWVIVDVEGCVRLPQVGKVKLAGLTILEAENLLVGLYAKYIVSPVVVVKVINIEVTVLGEVKNPANYVLDKENNTLAEVIGKAGGLDFYANKKCIQVVRGSGKNTQQIIIDMTSMENYQLMNLRLESGDVVYVPTRKGKMIDKKAPIIIPFVSLVTAMVVLLNVVSK